MKTTIPLFIPIKPLTESSPTDCSRLLRRFLEETSPQVSSAEENELRSLGQGRDPAEFFERLFGMGMGWIRIGQEEKGLHTLSWLHQQSQDPKFSQEFNAKLGKELQGISGHGPFGTRFEYLLQKTLKEATSYRNILPMVTGSAVYGIARAGALARLLQHGSKAWYARGIAARGLVAAAAFPLEVATFSSVHHALNAPKGISWQGFAQGLPATAISLAFLKSSGAFSETLTHWLRLSPSKAAASWLIPQTSMFLGLWAAHRTEQALGLRGASTLEAELLDTLASHFSMQVGGNLGHWMLGKRFAALNHNVNQKLAENGPLLSAHSKAYLRDLALAPMWMAMGTGVGGFGRGPTGSRWERIQHFFHQGPRGLLAETPANHAEAFARAAANPETSLAMDEEGYNLKFSLSRGFLMEATGPRGFRIVRRVGKDEVVMPVKQGKTAYLRDGDVLQIQADQPFIFRDTVVPIFRGGHRYPNEKIPTALEEAMIFLHAKRQENPARWASNLPIRVGYHRSLGYYLEPLSPEFPVTVYSAASPSGETFLQNARNPIHIFLNKDDVIQLGNEAPFVLDKANPFGGSFPQLDRVVRSKTPEAFVDLCYLAFNNPNNWIPGFGEFSELKIHFDPKKNFLQIALKNSASEEKIYVSSHDTQFAMKGTVGFDIRQDRILQIGEKGQAWTFRMDQVRERVIAEQRRQQEEARQKEEERRQEEARRREEEQRRQQRRANEGPDPSRRSAGGSAGSGSSAGEDPRSKRTNGGPKPRPFRSNMTLGQACLHLGGKTDYKSEREVKAQYRAEALKNHPDRFTDPIEKKEAEARFKKCMEAYLVICHELGFETTQN